MHLGSLKNTVDIFAANFERKSHLKEKKLELRKMELQLQERKWEMEKRERKQRLELESEEKRAFLEMMKLFSSK